MKKLLVIAISLIMLVSLCSCSSDSRIDELEKRVEVLENAVGINENNDDSTIIDDSTINDTNYIDYKDTRRIDLVHNIDAYTFTRYEITKNEDKCIISYSDENGDITSGTFSLEVYDELLDLIASQGIEEYENTFDKNGKLVEDNQPYRIYLQVGQSDSYYLKMPSNIDEIVAKFESLKELAEE